MAEKIISGGPTGVDRAALDVGLALGLDVGGGCPQGWRAEDGFIPDRHPVRETPVVDSEFRPRSRPAVVLADRRLDPPRAAHPPGEGHQIARPDHHGFAARGGYGDLARQDVAGFLGVVLPREFRHLLGPDRPAFHAQRPQSLGVGMAFDRDGAHAAVSSKGKAPPGRGDGLADPVFSRGR